jgi:plasmid maintenance system killer protein
LEVHFANPELERLYTDNAGADKFTAETVKLFRRRVRHIEAANDLNDLRCPSVVAYKLLSAAYPQRSSLALDDDWDMIISEELQDEPKRIVVLAISERREEIG